MGVLKRNLLVQFSVTFVTMAVIATLLAFVSANNIRSNAIDDLVTEAVGASSGRLLSALTPADLLEPMAGDRYDAFHTFVQQSIVSQRTARVKVWAKDGTVIYSNDPAGVGEKHPSNDPLQRALRGENAYEIKLPTDLESDRERTLGSLIEVYTPIFFSDAAEPQGAFELYQYYGPTAERIATLHRWLFGSLGAGFLTLYGALVGIVWRGWRTIEQQRAILEYQAHHDPLTGAANRRLLRARMEEHIEGRRPYTIVMVDLDGLRSINNRHGHAVGDEALVALTERMKAVTGPGDLIARLGGDEFVIVSTTPTRELVEVLSELRKRIEVRYADLTIDLSFTYGTAAYPDDGETPDVLLALADYRMYQQKDRQDGKDRAVALRDAQTSAS